jgi:translation initiation factor 2 alpha subunit (eIF-2alpha)
MSYRNDLFNNRLYLPLFPGLNDIVMVQIIDIDDDGAKCKLLEYGEIEGFVPKNEFTKKGRMKSTKEIFQKGLNYPLQVIRVEENKGYVDLSKKHVTANEVKECMKRYKEAKAADSILQRAATLCQIPKIEIYEKCIWPLCTFSITHDISGERITLPVSTELNISEGNEEGDYERQNRSALEVLEFLIKTPSIIDPFQIDQTLKNMLIQLSTKKLQQKTRRISATIQLTCFGNGGIISIRKILSKGLEFAKSQTTICDAKSQTNTPSETEENASLTIGSASSLGFVRAVSGSPIEESQIENETEDKPIPLVVNIYSVGCPDYELTIETKEVEKGLDLLERVIEHMQEEHKQEEGASLIIKTQPHILGE